MSGRHLAATSVDQCLADTIEEFFADPFDLFHEHEVHDEFYRHSRYNLGTAMTADGLQVHLLRHEYNTIWRYHRRAAAFPFRERLRQGGGVGNIDFAILRREFVEQHTYLEVMNKEERLRRQLRVLATEMPRSFVIERAIEFKMAHCHSTGHGGNQRGVRLCDFLGLKSSVMCDCRKLANEGPAVAYIVCVMHPTIGNWFEPGCVKDAITAWRKEWEECSSACMTQFAGDLRVLVSVAGNASYCWGGWEASFPHEVVVQE